MGNGNDGNHVNMIIAIAFFKQTSNREIFRLESTIFQKRQSLSFDLCRADTPFIHFIRPNSARSNSVVRNNLLKK